MKSALIVGATGQDGAYLARFLLGKGYSVHGTSRVPDARVRLSRLAALGVLERVTLHALKPTEFRAVTDIVLTLRPDEIYNLSGQSSVALSFTQPGETIESIIDPTLYLLEAAKMSPRPVRFYNAGSSEIFGDVAVADEDTPFRPESPYGVAKAAAVTLVRNYREAYGVFACSGLLFNHESPLRSERFVTRKITAAAARIRKGSRDRLRLGNLQLRRDFGWAPEYVEAMWRMLQIDQPSDFVIASGDAHSLEEFVHLAFCQVGLDWRMHVDSDPAMTRPSDITSSCGNANKAKLLLDWQPIVRFPDIVRLMMRSELEGAGSAVGPVPVRFRVPG